MTERTFLLDVNVLVALANPNHIRHEAAHQWLSKIGRDARWATTPLTESAFVRLSANPVVVGQQIAPATAIRALADMRAMASHVFMPDSSSPVDAHIDVSALAGTKQVTDFHLLNLAAGAGAVLATFDGRIL